MPNLHHRLSRLRRADIVHPSRSVRAEKPALRAPAAIAGLLIPLHHRMEKLITNMLASKNNRVRSEAARRTIEELEARADKES